METRRRKRAEATSTAPSSSSSGPVIRSTKRTRLSAAAASPATTVPATATARAPASAVSTRSRASRSQDSLASSTPMDSMNESSASASRGGRGKRQLSPQENSDKGKEKEHDIKVRDRQRDTERSLGLNIDGGGAGGDDDDDDDDDDDSDSEGGDVGILKQNLNLTSASNALQGILRKLGAGLDDLLPSSAMASASSSHQNGRLKTILSALRADGAEGKQTEALYELCEILSIGTEDSLRTFSVDSFVPVLVGLLNHESNADIMLLAARALTHLCDVLPSSCDAVVHYGAVSCFVARLLTIEYMDLAEQSLQALNKISVEHPTACLRAGALMAVLSYLDFFSTGVQRVALSTAANMCKKLPSDAADYVMDAVPLLTNLLQYHDAKVLEHASVCLTRIAEAFASSPNKIDELCNHGLVTQTASLISTSSSGGGQATLSTSTYTGLFRLLSTCVSGSALATKTLLLLGISGILKEILSGSGLVANLSVSAALSRPPELIFEIMILANELLPPLPQGTISLPASTNLFIKGFNLKKSTSGGSGKQEDSSADAVEISPHEKLLNEQPQLLQQFGMDLLPVQVQIYGSSVNGPVRHKCLSVIGKLMYFSSTEMIQSLVSTTNISSFLAGVLAWKDPQVLVPALQIAEILMEKLPSIFSKLFVREGVVHAVEALVMSTSPSTTIFQPNKDNNSVVGMPSRSRRHRRRGGNSIADVNLNSSEDSKNPVGSARNQLEISNDSYSLRTAVSARAKAFKDKYFLSDIGSTEAGVTDDLLHLKNLCTKLNAGLDDQKTRSKGKSKAASAPGFEISISKEEDLISVVMEIVAELSKGGGVSTFEFIGSGVVSALLNYFSCGYFSRDRVSEVNLPKLRQQAIKRYKSFVAIALPSTNRDDSPMSILVKKLQNALSSLERFPLVLSHNSRSSTGGARLSSGLSALSHLLKLRLCRAQGEKDLRDYSSQVVLIDPLASIAAIEEWLWPRVQQSESVQKLMASGVNSESGTTGAGPRSGAIASSPSSSTPASTTRRVSTRSRISINIGENVKKDLLQEKNTSSSKGKGKSLLKTGLEEGRGVQTRIAARRRAALDKDADMKPVNGDSSSEDEDFEISSVDIDDALVIEDDDDISEDEDDDHDDDLGDDSPPICMPDRVHDVKLADSSEDSLVAPTTSDSHINPASGSSSRTMVVKGSDSLDFGTSGTRTSMSFAAAAMAGLASANGSGIRGARDRQGHSLLRSNDPPRLIFSSGEKQFSKNSTVYQAIQRQIVLDDDYDERNANPGFISGDRSQLFGDIYTLTYQKAETSGGTSSSTTPTKSTKSGSSSATPVSLLDSILQGELPCDLEKNNPTYNILALLRVLEGLNQLAPRLTVHLMIDLFSEGKLSNLDDLTTTTGTRVLDEEFINSKLTPKLARQIQDALALCSGSLPSWCYQLTRACPFLFPFETRRQYFYSTAFGLSRALNRLQQQGSDGNGLLNEREVRVGRLQRQKVSVSRNRILDSAVKVMEMYSSHKAVLEVEYFGEVGTGLGPTLEFYTLLSHDLQKVGLGMWRLNSSFDKTTMDVDADRDFVQSPLGLFPRPWSQSAVTSNGNQLSKVVEYFRLLGRVIAKALQDGRLLDLPLSVAFYKLVLGQELDLHDIRSFDPELGKTLQELEALVCRKQHLKSIGADSEIDELRFRGSLIDDICLDFTLPGYPDYILKPGDNNVDVNNLEDYISLVVDATVNTGIMRQIEAFKAGFNQVFDISTLQIFSANELDYLLCGRKELWEPDSLVDHIKFDHGYTAKSPAILNLLEIMGAFTPEQQRVFCQFVTGAPRLPPGGLAALNPKLTVVRKHSSTSSNTAPNGSGVSESADDDLPSVMTCANYLKLPPYSTKEIMYNKLMYAINEGQGSFDLS